MKEHERQIFKNHQFSAEGLMKKIVFKNCKFLECDFSDCTVVCCSFDSCEFVACKFKNAFVAESSGKQSGNFISCVFSHCDLTRASFRFPVIRNCTFQDCVCKEVNFDGSRFFNTRFIGTVDSCFFRGHSIYANVFDWWGLRRTRPQDLRNEMVNVDFSNCTMIGNTFSHSIDLRKCLFPKGEDYLFITNLPGTSAVVQKQVEKEFPDLQEQSRAIKILEFLLFSKDHLHQPNTFVDAIVFRESDKLEGSDLGIRLFKIMVEAENSIS